MDLRQIEYFVAVAEEMNFTKAAERVHITQSGISAQIRQFERELGAPLFERTSRRVRLTAAGQAALPYARSALAAAEGIRQVIDDVTGLIRGQLRIGMITGCTVAPLFEALAAFHYAHPSIEITLSEANSDVLTEQVRAGDVDFALIGAAGDGPEDLTSHTVISEGLVALVPPEHALAASAEVSLRRLSAYPLIGLPEGTGIRSVLDQACATARLTPNVALQATAPGAVADLADRGLGVAVLSASMATDFPKLIAVPITGVGLAASLALVWVGDGSLQRAFLPYFRKALGEDIGNDPTGSVSADQVAMSG